MMALALQRIFNDLRISTSRRLTRYLPLTSKKEKTTSYYISLVFRFVCVLAALVFGFSLYYRTTNLWALKNLGDTFIHKVIGQRLIVIGVFHRLPEEQNVNGAYAVVQFVGDTSESYQLYCISGNTDAPFVSLALTQRIHQGKRGVNGVCAWSGHIAECEIDSQNTNNIRLTTNPHWSPPKGKGEVDESALVAIEKPLRLNDVGKRKHDLVVCVAPLYIYTEWQILVTGVEAWLALGATKFVFPVQSASNDTWMILKEYERQGIALIRHWPKWPILSDVNPNGLVLSRGIEESHVNCLHFAKPFSDLIVFTDIDDMLLPLDPMKITPTVNVDILRGLFAEHPNSGSLLFEHRDVQFVLPDESAPRQTTLDNFNFDFLLNSHWKTNCKVWRMKTRVAVNASRVDTVNMHETGLHRFGHVQTRVPCQRAHFHHLRHSYKDMVHEQPIQMNALVKRMNDRWRARLASSFNPQITHYPFKKSSTASFEDFDRCVEAINNEHYTLRVSRCMTPHVCYTTLSREIGCVASLGDYEFAHTNGNFIISLREASFGVSEPNCEAPLPKYLKGNYFYLP